MKHNMSEQTQEKNQGVNQNTEPTQDELQGEYEDRKAKIARLEEKGLVAYPSDSNRTHQIVEIMSDFPAYEKDEAVVTITGRIRSKRTHGNLSFMDVEDASGRMQIAVSKKGLETEELYKPFVKLIDTGDFIQITGTAFVTKAGQESIMATDWKLLTKALRNMPTDHFGLKDEDDRFRKRYIDIALNDPVAEMIRKKSLFWNTMRQFLLEKNFIEVETPVLENTVGGADARPFETHHNALDIDVYLRISAGELWQKKLMVAGLERTFEIGRIFRNEGISKEHLQDYTQLEYYMAYADYNDGMAMTQELYRKIAHDVFGTSVFNIHGHEIDLDADWDTINLCEIIQERFGIKPLETTVEEVVVKLDEYSVDYDQSSISIARGVDLLWKSIRKEIAGPAFLVGVPVYLEPLAKRSPENTEVVERFQVILAGSEMGKGFSELNDPTDQRERFEEQQAMRDAGDDEAQMADMEYVEALEYGMPPTFGFGVSERLFSFLMDKPVRETQIFPLMKPKQG